MQCQPFWIFLGFLLEMSTDPKSQQMQNLNRCRISTDAESQRCGMSTYAGKTPLSSWMQSIACHILRTTHNKPNSDYYWGLHSGALVKAFDFFIAPCRSFTFNDVGEHLICIKDANDLFLVAYFWPGTKSPFNRCGVMSAPLPSQSRPQ